MFDGERDRCRCRGCRNKPKLDSTAHAGKGVFTDDLMKVEDIKNGYCTQFLVHKDPGASITRLRAFLESNGDCCCCDRG